MDKDRLPSLRERLRRGDSVLYYVPFLYHPISINEFHAHVIGFVTGVLLSFAYSEGFEGVAVLGTSVLVAYAVMGVPRFGSLSHDDERYNQRVGLRTIRWEPWHFLGLFLLGTVVVLLHG
jgi:hypothetical protein